MNENENSKITQELILTKDISSAIHREVYSILKDNNDLSLVKSLKIEKNKGNFYYQAEKEYRIGKILGLITDSVPKIYKTEKFDNNSEIEINTSIEYVGKDLFKIDPILLKSEMPYILFQLIDILMFMERVGVVHFDFKPENLVWDENKKRLKLIDFETSMTFFNFPEQIKNSMRISKWESTGYTSFYQSPESKLKDTALIIPQKVDIYSFGITILALFWALDGNAKKAVLLEQLLDKYKNKPFIDTIKKCVSANPEDRPTLEKIKKDFLKIYPKYEKVQLTPTLDLKLRSEKLIKDKEYEAAALCYQEYLSRPDCKDNNNADLYEKLGYIWNELSYFIKACDYFGKAINLYTKSDKVDENHIIVLKSKL